MSDVQKSENQWRPECSVSNKSVGLEENVR